MVIKKINAVKNFNENDIKTAIIHFFNFKNLILLMK